MFAQATICIYSYGVKDQSIKIRQVFRLIVVHTFNRFQIEIAIVSCVFFYPILKQKAELIRIRCLIFTFLLQLQSDKNNKMTFDSVNMITWLDPEACVCVCGRGGGLGGWEEVRGSGPTPGKSQVTICFFLEILVTTPLEKQLDPRFLNHPNPDRIFWICPCDQKVTTHARIQRREWVRTP